ncbi:MULTISPECIES: hypothetical protein [Haloarcula]|nr:MULTISPECIES: hypothetical protein [Haloarcula]
MKETDDSILDILSQTAIPVQRGTILWYINANEEFPDTARTTFYRRTGRLVYADLVTEIDERFFELADYGERYLSDELSAAEEMEISKRMGEGPPNVDS